MARVCGVFAVLACWALTVKNATVPVRLAAMRSDIRQELPQRAGVVGHCQSPSA